MINGWGWRDAYHDLRMIHVCISIPFYIYIGRSVFRNKVCYHCFLLVGWSSFILLNVTIEYDTIASAMMSIHIHSWDMFIYI